MYVYGMEVLPLQLCSFTQIYIYIHLLITINYNVTLTGVNFCTVYLLLFNMMNNPELLFVMEYF